MPYFCQIDSGPIWKFVGYFFCQITSKKLSLCSWEITKKSLWWKGLNFFFSFFDLMDLKIWDFWQIPSGVWKVKNSMGLQQGSRLMARTTKSPILGNHWVPLVCKALLGSDKFVYEFDFDEKNDWHHIVCDEIQKLFQKMLCRYCDIF